GCGRRAMRLHPRNQVSAFGESFAASKDLAKPFGCAPRRIFQELVPVSIDIAEKGEISGIGPRRKAVGLDIFAGRILDDQQTRKMQILEVAERNERVAGVDLSGRIVHRCQQAAKLRLTTSIKRSQSHETRLWRH